MKKTGSLANLIDRFGWAVVYDAGLAIFGYPPFWDPNLDEVLNLKRHLEELER